MKRRGLLLAAACAPAVAATAALPGLPPVLRQPALATTLATGVAMLAAARAGRRLVAGGERGIVVTSDDGGATWAQAKVPAQVSLTSFAFVDDKRGWATGHFGTLLNTTDGGASWQLQMDGARAAQLTLDSAADDAQRKAAQRKVADGPDKPFFDLVHDGQRGIAVGAYGLALETVDGRTWKSLAPRLPNPKQLHLYAVRRAGERIFMAGEQGLLLRSADGGASFEALPSPYKGSLFGLLAAKTGTLLAFGLRGSLFRSTDHGSSWQAVPSGTPVTLGAGLERADGSLWLLAQNGDLLVSRDDGRSFERRAAPAPFPAAAFAEGDGRSFVLAGLRGLQRQDLA